MPLRVFQVAVRALLCGEFLQLCVSAIYTDLHPVPPCLGVFHALKVLFKIRMVFPCHRHVVDVSHKHGTFRDYHPHVCNKVDVEVNRFFFPEYASFCPPAL